MPDKYEPIVHVERDPNDPNRIIASGPGIDWLVTHQPPPSLEKLVEEAGAWHKITPQAWGEFYVEMEKWKLAVRWGDRYQKQNV